MKNQNSEKLNRVHIFYSMFLYPCILVLCYFMAGCLDNPKYAEKKKDDEAKLVFSITGSTGDSFGNLGTVQSCGSGASAFSFAAGFSPAVTPTCTSCHSGASPSAGFNITNYSASVSRIVSGDPAKSLLYTKITTGSMKGYANSAIVSAAYSWICGGGAP